MNGQPAAAERSDRRAAIRAAVPKYIPTVDLALIFVSLVGLLTARPLSSDGVLPRSGNK